MVLKESDLGRSCRDGLMRGLVQVGVLRVISAAFKKAYSARFRRPGRDSLVNGTV